MRTIKEFTQHVKGHIRNKEAHDAVEKELTYHLVKSKLAWQEKGHSDADAEQQAVREMGNATNLGVSLNQIHLPKIDWLLVIPFMLAAMCSFLPLLPAELSLRDFIMRNVVIVIGGIAVTIFLMRLDFRKLERYSTHMYVVACILFLIILNGNETINGVIFLDKTILFTYLYLPLSCLSTLLLKRIPHCVNPHSPIPLKHLTTLNPKR
ncbi:permease prefix domain 1-containing protein [Lysinibacillus sp. FJAT-14745]|uniref:permease prefix domain 1-containing protein n=1 Tax=Lysinibacillus sp. FJAT-14745 TaxID=1704289 RepID=UPI0006ABBB8E|nr:permease prefix domain 1-containing protein [Lysinibacillus sp. FJAT-14745]